jgi:hypothetical protein
LDSKDKVLTPALWQAYVNIAEAGMEVYEAMAAVLVEGQAPPDAGKVQSILDTRKLQEQMGNQLHAVHDVLAAGWEGDEIGKISSLDIWRLLGLPLSRCLPCDQRILSETDRASCKIGFFFKRVIYLYLFGVKHTP